MAKTAKINEIFESVQGEGLYVGTKQLFIRFCGCNLNCEYCDTDFKNGVEFTSEGLFNKINQNYNLKSFHSVSLTGGEPLLSVDFLEEFLSFYKQNNAKPLIYLETNGILSENFLKIKDKIDIVSADIKLKSSSGKDLFGEHKTFLKNCHGVETFAKIVFDENITDEEIQNCVNIGKECNIELILQPKMNGSVMSVSSEFCYKIFDRFTRKYPRVRLIPQTHKFLGII